MARVCCVVGCDTTSNDVTYFKFPTSLTLKRKWLSVVRVDGKVTVDSVVCSRHFEPSDYEFVRGKHRLKGKVVPNMLSVASDGPSVAPDVPSVAPDVLSVAPDVPSVAPDGPSVAPDVPSVAPDGPSVAPDGPSVAPDVPTVVTDVPTAVTDVPSGAAEVSSVMTDVLSVEPNVPSVVPDVPTMKFPSTKSSEESSPTLDNNISTRSNNLSEETQLKNIEEENKQKRRVSKLSPETEENVSIENGEIENTLVKDKADSKEACGKGNDSDSATSLGIANLDSVSVEKNGDSNKNNYKKTKRDRVSKKKKKVNSKSSKTFQDDTIDIHKQDLEEIITNYQIKQVKRPRDVEDSSERRSNGTQLDLTHEDSNDCVDLGYDYFKQPTYVEIPMDQGGVDGEVAGGARDCLMVLESVQVDVDPALLLAGEDPSDDDTPGPQKADPISLLTSSDEDDVIIQEPHIDTYVVSDETDDDDVPLVRLLKAQAKPGWSARQLHQAASKDELKGHRASHSTTLLFCNACDYSTTSKSQYSKHKRKHRSERAFRCDICSYKAKHRMSLLYHLRTHSVKELCNVNSKLVCDKCGFVAVNYILLKKHRQACNSSKKYNCDVCMYVTKKPSDLRRHRTRKHKCQDSDEDYVPTSEVIWD